MPPALALVAVELSFLTPDKGCEDARVDAPFTNKGDVRCLVDSDGDLVLCGGEGEVGDLVLVLVEVAWLWFLVQAMVAWGVVT